jgi:hypothetical protein
MRKGEQAMTAIHWMNAVNGSFTNATDWNGKKIPGASDDAVLDAVGAAFTVTSGMSETVQSVQLASNATLSLTGGVFTASDGTGLGSNAGVILVGVGATLALANQINNSGRIAVEGSATLDVEGDVENTGVILLSSAGGGSTNIAAMTIASNTTLSGGGGLDLSDSRYNEIVCNGATLTNVDNMIYGAGQIGGAKEGFTLVNEAGGVIEAAGLSGLGVGSNTGERGTVTNDGLVKGTGFGLFFDFVTMDGSGGIVTSTAGSTVNFSHCTVRGQSFSLPFEASIFCYNSNVVINDPVSNDGVLGVMEHSKVRLQSTLLNSDLLSISRARLTVMGAVTGDGSVVIDRGAIEFDSTFGQNVKFTGKSGAGALVLGRSQDYDGVISNFSHKSRSVLDLRDIGFVGSSEATFSGTASDGLLTVTDGAHTASIRLQGDYRAETFVASADGLGGTDVIVQKAKDVSAPPHAFITAMAAFGGRAPGHAIPRETMAACTPRLFAPRVAIA